MKTKELVIDWGPSIEYLVIDVGTLKSLRPSVSSREWWGDIKEFVRYKTNATTKKMLDGSFEVTIEYRSSNNKGLIAKNIPFGKSTFYYKHETGGGRVRWTDEDGGVNYTAGKWKSVDDSLAKVKKEKTVKIVQRGQAFRDKLLEFERCCSISGENTCSALEAAHLIASKSSGAEIRENGILLRADLHRLYDAGQFTIDPKGRIVIGDGLSKDYQQQLRGKRLSAASYGRVQRALQKIAQDR